LIFQEALICINRQEQRWALGFNSNLYLYAGNFDGYSGEKFEIRYGREGRWDTVVVISNLVRPHEDSVDFYYTLQPFQDI
jgi:hypothetical protein